VWNDNFGRDDSLVNKEYSNIMKNQFVSALKKRLESTSLDKITVTELAADCGVNRQTFYYHFTDIYDLTDRMFRNEAEAIIGSDDEKFDWKESVRELILYINENHSFCVSLLNSSNHRMLKKIFTDSVDRLIRKVLASYGNDDSKPKSKEEEELREFNIRFYSLAVSGLIESWVLGEVNISSEKLTQYIESIIMKNLY
jgi:probable dihydroxyacetone kinase regulator